MAPEQTVPIMDIPKPKQRRIAQNHQYTRFVEMRLRILRTGTLAWTDTVDILHLLSVERAFEIGIAQPDHRIEQVVPIGLAGSDQTMPRDAFFIVQAIFEQRARLDNKAFAGRKRPTRIHIVNRWPKLTFKPVPVVLPMNQRCEREDGRIDRFSRWCDIAHTRAESANQTCVQIVIVCRLYQHVHELT